MSKRITRTCGTCRWLDWDTDRCLKDRQVKTIDEEACRGHETKDEWLERVFGKEKEENGKRD